ncbi:MAG: hypothetical protein WC582_00035 [Patescibacteria group bacterium]|jgi:hypothetical protein
MLDLSKFSEYFYYLRQKFSVVFSFLSGFLFIRLYFIILLGFNLFVWLLVYLINGSVSQDLVVLHYNVDFGVDLIGEVKRLFIIPVLSLIIILANEILLFAFYRRKDFKFLAHLFLGASLLVNLFLLIALGAIYLINFS